MLKPRIISIKKTLDIYLMSFLLCLNLLVKVFLNILRMGLNGIQFLYLLLSDLQFRF